MSWIFINIDMTPNSIDVDMSCIFISDDRTPNSIIDVDMFWIFINADMTPNLSTLIELQILST